MRLLICAGGTGGGVFPALTIIQMVKAERSHWKVAELAGSPVTQGAYASPANLPPGTSNLELLWVGGAGGMEVDLVKRAEIPFQAIPAAGIHGVGMRALPGNVLQLIHGLMAARKVMREFRPDALLFTGGYVAVPVGLAARLPLIGLKRPRVLLYVPDIEPGWALKVLARFADHIAITVEQSRSYISRRTPSTVTGYPIRPDLKIWDQAQARRALGIGMDLPVLLVSGGSRGARLINRALLGALPDLLNEMEIIHLTGQADWPDVEKAWLRQASEISAELARRYHGFPFLHEEMGAAMTVADLALSRAGASCLGEYPYFSLPAVLVPYPYAWRYQKVNAQYMVDRGAAVLLDDADVSTRMLPVVSELMRDKPRRLKMRQAMHSLAQPQAAERIGALLYDLAISGYQEGI